jgi:ATP-dependent Clp protease adapter protein ClpS
MKKKKSKKRKPPERMKVVTLNMDRDQIEVLRQIATDAGTTLEIVAAVFIATSVYKQRAYAKAIAPMT